MTPLVAIGISGLLLGVGVPAGLRRLRGLDHWPRLAVYLWLATTIGAITTLAMTALLLLVPAAGWTLDLAALLRTCVMAVRDALGTPGGAVPTLLGLALLGLVTGGVAIGAGGTVAGAVRVRQQHRLLLALAGRQRPELPGVTVLDHPTPLAYCLAGRRGAVVVTSAALARLDHEQLAAVLAHERAHQAGRHHAVVLIAEAVRAGFPWLPAARTAPGALRRLVECAADDTAAHRHGAAPVTAALANLVTAAPAPSASAPASAVALSASGGAGADPRERIERLLAPTAPPQRQGVLVLVAAVLLVAAPLALQVTGVAVPLLRAAGVPMCPLSG